MSPEWWVVRGPHGGYLAAIMLRALTTTLGDPSRPIRSFTTHFVAAPKEGDLDISVRHERSGRSASFLSARAEQNGKPVALSLAAFSADWPSKLEFQDAPMPEVPSPDDAIYLDTRGEMFPPFLGNFDMRATHGAPPFSGADKAELGGWFRLREPERADAFVVACLMDAWAPVVFPKATDPLVAPTIDFTVHFRSPLPLPGTQADDFYLGVFDSVAARDGFFEEDGRLWSPDGTLIAQSRQLALMLF
jgi:acyl-CoA thioesterase